MDYSLQDINYKPNKLLRFWRKLGWLFKVYLRPQHEAVVNTANGILSFNSKDKKTGRSIYVERHFEYDMMLDTIDFLHSINAIKKQKGMGTVLDVGGYIGMTSTAFMLSNQFERSIAFEPNPDSYHLLQNNISHNHLNNRITAHNIALSDDIGELTFELSHDNFGDHRIRSSIGSDSNEFNESSRKTINIKADSLDNLINNGVIRNPDDIALIWMDVQGHEGRFIKGAVQFIEQHKNIPIVMEFWPYAINKSGMSKDEFISVISNLYNTFYFMAESEYIKHPITSLKGYYEKFDGSDSASVGGSIILLNE